MGNLSQLLGQEATPRGGYEGGVTAHLAQVKEAARGAPPHAVIHIQSLRQGCTVPIAAVKGERKGRGEEEKIVGRGMIDWACARGACTWCVHMVCVQVVGSTHR